MGDNKITKVWGRQILDSRGNPTVEVDIHTKHGMTRGAAPSGASTGTHESLELRDGKAPFLGKGVETAVANIRGPVAKLLVGMDVTDQEGLDRSLIEIDGTPNKSNLGGNCIGAIMRPINRVAGFFLYRCSISSMVVSTLEASWRSRNS